MLPLISGLLIVAVLGSLSWFAFQNKRVTHIPRGERLVVITSNSQSSIEWWVRSHMVWNWLRGNVCHCTCIDFGSTDDTIPIVNRLQQRYGALELIRYDDETETNNIEQFIPQRLMSDRPVVLDLRTDPINTSHSL